MKTSYDSFNESKRRRGKGGNTVFGVELSPMQMFAITYCSGVLTLLGTLLLTSLALYRFAHFVIPLIVAGAFCSLIAYSRNRTLLHRPMAVATLIALVIGSSMGLFIYDRYGYFAFLYGSSRTYRNVVVSQPAASVADAGHLIFAPEAYVDQTKAIGYAADNGEKYCVAPLRDLVNTTRVEFWAVGYGCCEWQGGFKCDAASDSNARGGIVVYQNPGFFTESNYDHYTEARKKAEAMYDLQSCDKPMYVRWVKATELDMLHEENETRTALMITISVLVYAVASFWQTKAYCKINHDEFLGLV